MPDDFKHVNVAFSADDADAKRDNHNTELSGVKSGYTYRTPAVQDESPEARAKKDQKKRDARSKLEALLADNTEYAAAYQAAHDTITEFKSRMHIRLAQLETQIQGFDEALETLKPGSAEYTRLMQQREAIQLKQQDLLDYYEETIRPAEDRMNDPDNPLSKSDLEDFDKKVQQNATDMFFNSDLHTTPVISKPLEMPILSIG